MLDVALPLRVPQPAEVGQRRDLQQVQSQVQQLLRSWECRLEPREWPAVVVYEQPPNPSNDLGTDIIHCWCTQNFNETSQCSHNEMSHNTLFLSPRVRPLRTLKARTCYPRLNNLVWDKYGDSRGCTLSVSRVWCAFLKGRMTNPFCLFITAHTTCSDLKKAKGKIQSVSTMACSQTAGI